MFESFTQPKFFQKNLPPPLIFPEKNYTPPKKKMLTKMAHKMVKFTQKMNKMAELR